MRHEPNQIPQPTTEAEPGPLDSATLARLMDEVRNERADVGVARSYDRTHNRHNR